MTGNGRAAHRAIMPQTLVVGIPLNGDAPPFPSEALDLSALAALVAQLAARLGPVDEHDVRAARINGSGANTVVYIAQTRDAVRPVMLDLAQLTAARIARAQGV